MGLKLLSFILGLVGVFWLAIAGAYGEYRYDRLACGWPNYRLNLVLFHPVLKLPDSQGCKLGRFDALSADAKRQAVQVRAADKAAVIKAGAEVRAERVRIEYVTRTNAKEIPVVVTPAIDRAYPLSVGFVRVHDAAALGLPLSGSSPAAGGADDRPSLVASSDLGATINANYGDCRADASELGGWQRFYAALVADRALAQKKAPGPSRNRAQTTSTSP